MASEHGLSGADVKGQMLQKLSLHGVGPAAEMSLNFGSRLNILTGDNGLGKSFLLDIIWWCLTRTWPAMVNPRLTAGKMALPHINKKGKIAFQFTGASKSLSYTSTFAPQDQAWTGKAGRPAIPGLVIYAMADGSLAAWDSARNYWRTKGGVDVPERLLAYVLDPKEVWDGLQGKDGSLICAGLLRDWAEWQNHVDRRNFNNLKLLLRKLSPSKSEVLQPGELTDISVEDSRKMPTLRMSYGEDVPIVHASAGMRRIVALSYFLLWVWNEHRRASKLLRKDPSNQVIVLFDEIESHLHPSWQRKIVPSILSEIKKIHKDAHIQLIAATHSPLIMSSIEPLFNPKTDRWFDLDMRDNKVHLQEYEEFEKYGEANSWLCSEAFGLSSTRAIEIEKLINKASVLLQQEKPNKQEIQQMNQRLIQALNPKDPYLIRWGYVCEQGGWLK